MNFSRFLDVASFFRGFKKNYPPATCYVFYGGSTPLYIDDITVLPIEYALKNFDRILSNTVLN